MKAQGTWSQSLLGPCSPASSHVPAQGVAGAARRGGGAGSNSSWRLKFSNGRTELIKKGSGQEVVIRDPGHRGKKVQKIVSPEDTFYLCPLGSSQGGCLPSLSSQAPGSLGHQRCSFWVVGEGALSAPRREDIFLLHHKRGLPEAMGQCRNCKFLIHMEKKTQIIYVVIVTGVH